MNGRSGTGDGSVLGGWGGREKIEGDSCACGRPYSTTAWQIGLEFIRRRSQNALVLVAQSLQSDANPRLLLAVGANHPGRIPSATKSARRVCSACALIHRS
jgi:hypothetical protein